MDIKMQIGQFVKSVRILIMILLISLGLGSCKKDEINPTPEQIEPGSWVTYSPYKWPHDGNPVSSQYCIVYSDGISREMKELVGKFSDNKFIEILQGFNYYAMENFLYPPQYDKIDVYMNLNNLPKIAAAYWGSILITVRSPEPDTTRLEYLFKHELTHEFEFLIEGTVNLSTDVWFKEGIAIYMGSNGGWDYISTVDSLDSWISRNAHFPNHGNPITIHAWEDFPEGSDITGYCTVFSVVMQYLLDSDGLGKSSDDVLNLFFDLRNGIPFPTAFQSNFGISLEELELEIFDRLHAYLENE